MQTQEKREIFTILYQTHWKKLYLHAYRMLEDQDEAKDIVQEVFSNLWESLDQITIYQSYNAYLYRSIRNVVINKINRNKLNKNFEIYSIKPSNINFPNTPEELLRLKDLGYLIESEINNLPEKMKLVFTKSRFENMSYKQIADELGIAEGTVKKQVYKALKILRRKIKFILILMYH
ncbi:RNA polymerase sigma factor [Sphingobacterium humi]|uniref:RNA polymerase sigma-70 factor n=1 Tax=Sphingobacterium humi TaxID=1796905 RepID=A0A6N8L3K3_9SPHI|nr:RNA polymerase sigma-70 factor [Sphingobacterium humi]MVZ63867.1 RNA polymerase sigma-70 factor [Sphingobacterium humi]